MSLLLEMFRDDGWHHVNRRPDQQVTKPYGGNVTVCPHYTLIKICSDLVGTGLAEQDQFCGQMGKYEDSIRVLSGFRGTRYEPRATCSQVHDALKKQVKLMEKEIISDTAKVEVVRRSSATNEQLKPVLDEHMNRVNTRRRQDEIFLRWQQVVFDNCCIPVRPNTIGESRLPIILLEREDPHFKRVDSPTDLTYEEVISRVKSFLMALREQVTGDDGNGGIDRNYWQGRFSKGALHCPQAPKRDEIGTHS